MAAGEKHDEDPGQSKEEEETGAKDSHQDPHEGAPKEKAHKKTARQTADRNQAQPTEVLRRSKRIQATSNERYRAHGHTKGRQSMMLALITIAQILGTTDTAPITTLTDASENLRDMLHLLIAPKTTEQPPPSTDRERDHPRNTQNIPNEMTIGEKGHLS